ncbi:uncharacterized protein LOC141626953 [Silene latifolia]|uniref:uncharacterized protein LOC141626953 n=1 Tax=Silene latifolia TaxID=37657 RepID=UPI003D77ABC2
MGNFRRFRLRRHTHPSIDSRRQPSFHTFVDFNISLSNRSRYYGVAAKWSEGVEISYFFCTGGNLAFKNKKATIGHLSFGTGLMIFLSYYPPTRNTIKVIFASGYLISFGEHWCM